MMYKIWEQIRILLQCLQVWAVLLIVLEKLQSFLYRFLYSLINNSIQCNEMSTERIIICTYVNRKVSICAFTIIPNFKSPFPLISLKSEVFASLCTRWGCISTLPMLISKVNTGIYYHATPFWRRFSVHRIHNWCEKVWVQVWN